MNSKTFSSDSFGEECIANLDIIFEKLENINISVNPSSRFAVFRRAFEKYYRHVVLSGKSPFDFNLPELLEGYRDYCELKLICSSSKLMSEAKKRHSDIDVG